MQLSAKHLLMRTVQETVGVPCAALLCTRDVSSMICSGEVVLHAACGMQHSVLHEAISAETNMLVAASGGVTAGSSGALVAATSA